MEKNGMYTDSSPGDYCDKSKVTVPAVKPTEANKVAQSVRTKNNQKASK